jgi:hypothetical protein
MDGEAVTLRPSIGNWDHPCRSHYLITRNKVEWARSMSAAQVESGRVQDEAMREAYFKAIAWPWWRRAASAVWTLIRQF